MDFSEWLKDLTRARGYRDQIAHVEVVPARPARFGALARPLPRALAEYLKKFRIDSLYSHQAEAVELVRRGRDVVVVTGTSSGKTLCYNLPVAETLLADRKSTRLNSSH